MAEPNLALVDTKRSRLLEVGDAAAAAAGKAEGHLEIVRPIRNGRLVDVAIAERYFRQIFKKMGFGRLGKPAVALATPPHCTAAEKKVLASTLSKAGASSVIFVDALLAAAIGAQLDIQGPRGSMVASVGAQTTFAGVLALGEALTVTWELTGGASISSAIADYLRSQYNFIILDQDLEELKLSLLDLSNPDVDLSARVLGRDAETGGEAEVTIRAREVYDASLEPAKLIVDTIVAALVKAPAEIAKDLVETGLTLVGRASLTTGLDAVLEQSCSIPVTHSTIVETAAVVGTARLLGQVPIGG